MKREGVYRPKYKDKRTGELKESAIWWIRYTVHGVKRRKSSKSEIRDEALAFLDQQRIKPALPGAARRTTLADLANLVYADYIENGRDTIRRQKEAFAHLIAYFRADRRADEITTLEITAYKKWRREQPKGAQSGKYARRNIVMGCSVATLNRELAALRHAFALAVENEIVTSVPVIKLLKEKNQRQGFFEHSDFERVREFLPDYLQPVMTVALIYGLARVVRTIDPPIAPRPER